MEFWVNSSDGSPYFFVTAEVNEKMGEMLVKEIIPRLMGLHPASDEHRKRMEENPDEPLFTLVFDREAWSPAFFVWLWNTYRISIITYRKNVTDEWDESLFADYQVITSLGDTTMKLHEQAFCHDEFEMREVRKLSDTGHQTSIVTTNKILPVEHVASHMFARWAQENFFRYMRQEYALDKIIQYSIDNIDSDIKVVNQEYNNITYRIKKDREKLGRRKAKLYELELKNPMEDDNNEKENEKENEKRKKWMKNKLELIEEIQLMEQQIECMVKKRKEIPYKIPLSLMPESIRYNRLNKESKKLMNGIKMICYRAETALAALLSPHYKRANHEIRALIKSIIHTHINLEVDDNNQALNITLYPLANQRSNQAVAKICDTVNQTCTVFPGTNLKLFFKIATI
jgi:hypothetical protein